MRAWLVAVLLLLVVLPLPSAAALPFLAYDFADPRDDVLYTREETTYEVPFPRMDVVRMTTGVVGEEVVQTLYFAEAGGQPDLEVEVSNGLTEGGSGQMLVTIQFDDAGQPPATVDAQWIADAIASVPVQVSLEGDALRLAFAVADMPEEPFCFHPSANLHWGLHHAEWVEVQPSLCGYGEELTDGLDGTCPPAPEEAVLAFSTSDPAGDVTGMNPETFEQEERDEPGFDLVGFESRREGDRIVHVLQYAGEMTNGSHLINIAHGIRDQAVSLEFSTSFGGLLPDEARGNVQEKEFHVDFERGADRVTLSYCASVLPQPIPCVYTTVGLNAGRLDFSDPMEESLEVGDETCTHGEDGGSGSGDVGGADGGEDGSDATGGSDGSDGAGSGGPAGDGAAEGEAPADEGADAGGNDAPGAGLLAVIVAFAAVALVLRRR